MLKNLSIRDKRVVIVLVILALLIPIIIFGLISKTAGNLPEESIAPTQKPPLPTFAEAPKVEGELTIKYLEGMAFDSLTSARQSEIMSELESLGVISQEKIFDSTEGELSTLYLLKFKTGVDIESAAQKIYEMPEIESAEPNYEVGLF